MEETSFPMSEKTRLEHWREFDFLSHCCRLAGEPCSFAERGEYFVAFTSEAGSLKIKDAYELDPDAFQGWSEEDNRFYFALKRSHKKTT